MEVDNGLKPRRRRERGGGSTPARESMPSHDYSIVHVPDCGYGLRAERDFSSGELVFREHPIAALRTAALHAALDQDHQLRADAEAAADLTEREQRSKTADFGRFSRVVPRAYFC